MKRKISRKKSFKVKDIQLPEDYNIRKHGISQSLAGQFPICRQRFLFKINRWLNPLNWRAPVFGNYGHEVLERAYRLGKAPSKRRLETWVDKYSTKLLKYYDKEHILIDEEFIEQTAEKCIVTFTEYFKHYYKDFELWKMLEVEGVFKEVFEGFPIRGKKDGLFCLKKNPKFISLLEHKTKGRVDSDILEGVLNFDFQNLTYITADDLKRGQDLRNVLYNIIRNVYFTKKKETWTQSMTRLKQQIQKDPDYYFMRYKCVYTSHTKKKFKADLKNILLEIEKFLHGELPCYQNRLACKSPYKCEFLDACASGNMAGYIRQSSLFPELDL